MNDVAIKVDSVSKMFKLPHEKRGSIKNVFIGLFDGKRTYERQEVLKNVSLEIKKGEFFGVVGRNGSGKSTLLKLLAGVYSPNKGAIHINGKLTPFIELGVGFNPELTGRENVYLNGALLGFSRKEVDDMYEEIVKFAELDKFMDQKLKNYSSGMQVRLAFSIAIRAKTEILVLDEVLAVGDAIFQKKCYDYFKKLKKDKRTVVFVSHDTNAVLEYCDRAVLIENGVLEKEGTARDVVKAYTNILNEREAKAGITTGRKSTRQGTGDVRVEEVEITDEKVKKQIFTDEDKNICINITYKANKDVEKPVYGITIYDAAGQRIFQSNTLWSKIPTSDLKKGVEIQVSWVLPNMFNTGTFSLNPAVADSSGVIVYDSVDDAQLFKIRKELTSTAYVNIEHIIKVNNRY